MSIVTTFEDRAFEEVANINEAIRVGCREESKVLLLPVGRKHDGCRLGSWHQGQDSTQTHDHPGSE